MSAKHLTVEGFEQLTPQQMYDMSASHILSTGVKSEVNGRCQYAGTGCALAPFIKPEYREQADSLGPIDMVVQQAFAPEVNLPLLQDLAYAHDRTHPGETFMAEWKMFMRKLARKHSLSDEVLGPETMDETCGGPSCSLKSCAFPY
jgi:hypothetical protein